MDFVVVREIEAPSLSGRDKVFVQGTSRRTVGTLLYVYLDKRRTY